MLVLSTLYQLPLILHFASLTCAMCGLSCWFFCIPPNFQATTCHVLPFRNPYLSPDVCLFSLAQFFSFIFFFFYEDSLKLLMASDAPTAPGNHHVCYSLGFANFIYFFVYPLCFLTLLIPSCQLLQVLPSFCVFSFVPVGGF